MENITKESLLEIVHEIQSNFKIFQTKDDLKTKVDRKFELAKNSKTDELKELEKLCKLIKAHTTKVGILMSKFTNKESSSGKVKNEIASNLGKPFLTEVTDLTNAIWYVLSLLHIFHAKAVSIENYDKTQIRGKKDSKVGDGFLPKVFVETLDQNVFFLILNFNEMLSIIVKSLESLDTPTEEEEEKEKKNSTSATATKEAISSERLVCVGKIWSVCDNIIELLSSIPKVIIDYINTVTIKLLSDTLIEIAEWLEDPTLEDLDDPFGLGCNDDDSDFDDDDDQDGDKVPQEMIEFLEVWQTKVKLIKLLMNSLKQSLNKSVLTTSPLSAKTCYNLQSIYELQKKITIKVDDLISTVFLTTNNENKDPLQNKDITDLIEDLNKNTILKICTTVIALNSTAKGNKDSEKWIDTWKIKYF